jgi:hypothetical protein
MAEQNSRTMWGSGVRIGGPNLHTLRFSWGGTEPPELTTSEVEYTLGLHRFGRSEIGVEFGIRIEGVPDLEAEVSYRMIVSLKDGSSEAENPDTALRQIAARLAPVAIYPFLREGLASVATRAGIRDLILPIQNVGALFSPDEISLPEE